MITATEKAKQYLKELLLAHTDDPDFGVRVALDLNGNFELVLDREAVNDQVIEHDGCKVLLVGHELAPRLEEVNLDVQDTPDGKKLVMHREQ